ncbi:hypothetical protein [Pseudonocardia sp. GCM10023141]|uniref:hypothetical protein n=1 Tax=Pseudonocardia sp. GCM10023141 TaxID=3252653 RepID=UPI00360E21BE
MTADVQDCGTFDLTCHIQATATSALDTMADRIAQGAADLVVAVSTWWVRADSVNPMDSAVLAAQGATHTIIVVIIIASILIQAIRLILSRKAEPLIMVATGLIRYALVSGAGLVALQSALVAGDAVATQLLDGAANNFALMMRDLLIADHTEISTFVVLLIALIAAIAAVVQWILMMLRQAGLLVLAAMLPLAASGSLTKSTRAWLSRLLSWLVAMAAYKPTAAFIYYIGFSYLSSPFSNDPGGLATMLTGIVVLLLAIIAMPVLLKFFSWTGTQISGSGGGGSGFLGAAGAVAMSRSYRGSQAVARAAATEQSGPGTAAGARPAGAAVGGASAGGGPAGAAGGAGAAAGPAAATVAVATAANAALRGVGTTMTGGGPR